MTEYEAMEVVAAYTDVAVTCFSIYLTLTFAYLTVAYLVGVKLTTFQSVAVSGLYVFGGGSALLCQYILINGWGAVIEYAVPLHSVPLWDPNFWITYMWTIQVSGILLGLYFMWALRQSQAE